MKAEKGKKVKVEYEGKFDDGTVFDSTEKHEGKPLEFEVGAGQVVKGFDEAIDGMEVGEEKEVKLLPEKAYGHPNPAMIKSVPRDMLPKEPEPKEGMMLIMSTPQGQQLPAKIAEIGKDIVKVDLNHPLAGKTLNFKLKLVGVE